MLDDYSPFNSPFQYFVDNWSVRVHDRWLQGAFLAHDPGQSHFWVIIITSDSYINILIYIIDLVESA